MSTWSALLQRQKPTAPFSPVHIYIYMVQHFLQILRQTENEPAHREAWRQIEKTKTLFVSLEPSPCRQADAGLSIGVFQHCELHVKE